MSAPKVGLKIKLAVKDKTRGFEEPQQIIDAMVACWDDLVASFQTLDEAGKNLVINYVDEQTGENCCNCLFGDSSDSFKETISVLDKPL